MQSGHPLDQPSDQIIALLENSSRARNEQIAKDPSAPLDSVRQIVQRSRYGNYDYIWQSPLKPETVNGNTEEQFPMKIRRKPIRLRNELDVWHRKFPSQNPQNRWRRLNLLITAPSTEKHEFTPTIRPQRAIQSSSPKPKVGLPRTTLPSVYLSLDLLVKTSISIDSHIKSSLLVELINLLFSTRVEIWLTGYTSYMSSR